MAQDEHIYHQHKDTPPEPEEWVLDGWLQAHARQQLDDEEVAETGEAPVRLSSMDKDERAAVVAVRAEKLAHSFKVHEPEWRADEAAGLGGYWVVVSEVAD